MKINKKNKNQTLNSYLEDQRAKKLAEMGDYLRHLREEQALSLEEVAGKTKVPTRMLIAIEEGNLDPLPEPVYIQGFLKRYADALGLNGREFASVFPTAQSFNSGKRFWPELPATQLKPIHLYFIYLVLIIFAVTNLSQMIQQNSQQAVLPGKEKSPVAKPLKPSPEKPKPDEVALVSMNISKSTEPVRVGLTATSNSWVRVTIDGKTEFEGTLRQGEQRTWTAKQELILRAGNAGGVLVAYNNEEAKQLGDPGTVKQVIYKKQSS